MRYNHKKKNAAGLRAKCLCLCVTSVENVSNQCEIHQIFYLSPSRWIYKTRNTYLHKLCHNLAKLLNNAAKLIFIVPLNATSLKQEKWSFFGFFFSNLINQYQVVLPLILPLYFKEHFSFISILKFYKEIKFT